MTGRGTRDPSPLVTFDPVDVNLESAIGRSTRPAPRTALRRRLGLQWSATSMPVALLLLLGIGLGPHGVNLLSLSVLAFLDPAMPVVLAASGVLVGLAVGVRRREDWRWLTMAGLEPMLTLVVIAIGALLIPTAVLGTLAVPRLLFGLLAGICAATSFGMPTGNPSSPETPVARVSEFEAALLIVSAGILLASIRESSFPATISLTGQACAVALVLAAAGRFLLTQTSSDTEQRVISLATLMLVGGVSDYLSLSPLLGGLITGVLWQLSGGPAREWMRRDALYVQHPLLVALLLIMGARVEPSTTALGLAGAYVVLRALGKVAGGALIGRFARRDVPHDFGQQLVRPGVLGVALALEGVRAVGSDLSVLVTVIVVGTIGSELIAGFLDRREVTR